MNSVSVSPGTNSTKVAVIKNSKDGTVGTLAEDITISVSTNGSPACSSLTLRISGPGYPADPTDMTAVSGCACNTPYVYSKDTDTFWNDVKADGTVTVLSGSTEVRATTTIYLK